jgi:hypothetical protein
MIKAIAHGKMYPRSIGSGDMSKAAVAFRSMSNQLTFMSDKYNASGVTTTTPKSDQYIFMDSTYNAEYDVNVLAGAFNMDKADFIGRLKLIDDWTTFDNDRFSEISAESGMIEPVTDDELALMKDVEAVLLDKEWFQVYDNMNKMTEKQVASGMYWNYFYNVWKTVSSSPFSNAIVFVEDTADTTLPTTIKGAITDKSVSDLATILTVEVDENTPALVGGNVNFVQTQSATTNGVAVHKYGAIMFPADSEADVTLEIEVNGTKYTASATVNADSEVGSAISFTNA